MKINDQSAYINFEAHAKRPQDVSSPSDTARADKAPLSTDKVVLSPKARELQDARMELGGLPDVDVRRVARIRHQIDKGTYEIDGGKIAERMLGEMHLNSRL